MTAKAEIVGRGVYPFAEASRLIAVPTAKLARWISETSEARLWDHAFSSFEGVREISFLDLQQLRFVSALRAAGISLQSIRVALHHATDVFNSSTPFSTARLRTDGRSVFYEVAKEQNEPELINLLNKQYAFSRILEPVLRDVEFDDEFASRWWPLGKKMGIVIDPMRNFGAPTDDVSGVTVADLASATRVEGSVSKVAALYDVPRVSVERSIRYQEQLAA